MADLLEQGKSFQVFNGTVSGGTTETVNIAASSDHVLIMVQITSVTTSLDIKFEGLLSVSDTSNVTDSISFPQFTAAPSTIVQRLVPLTGSGFKLSLTAVGDAVVTVWVKGVGASPQVSQFSASFTLTSDGQSEAIDVTGFSKGSFQLIWTGLDAFNATAIMQGSNDNSNWNDLGGADGGVILLNSPDSQVWEFKEFTTKYIRLDYTANNVTAGTGSWEFIAS